LVDPIANLYPISGQEFVSGLLESERFVFLDFFEVWRSNPFVVVLKKELVAFLNPDASGCYAKADILHGLRPDLLPPRVADASGTPKAVATQSYANAELPQVV